MCKYCSIVSNVEVGLSKTSEGNNVVDIKKNVLVGRF